MYVHYLKDAVFKWKRVYSIYYEMHLQNLFIGKVWTGELALCCVSQTDAGDGQSSDRMS